MMHLQYIDLFHQKQFQDTVFCNTLSLCVFIPVLNKYVGPLYCLTEMYVGCVSCCPLVSRSKHTDGTDRQTDGWTPDHYHTLSARRGKRKNVIVTVNV